MWILFSLSLLAAAFTPPADAHQHRSKDANETKEFTVASCIKDRQCRSTLVAERTAHLQSEVVDQVRNIPSPGQAVKAYDNDTRLYVSQFMDAYQQEKPDLSDDPNVKSHFVPALDPSAGEDGSQLVASFEISNVLEHDHILVDANLIVATDVPNQYRRTVETAHVQVHEKMEDGELGELVHSGKYQVTGNQRINIPLPIESVQRLADDSIYGYYVSAMINDHNVAVHPQQAGSTARSMILQITVKDLNEPVVVSRRRRSSPAASPVCTKKKPSEGCCLYEMHIQFDEIGWDWVIAPPRYNAYMCRGNCRLNYHHYMNDFGHSKIMRSASTTPGHEVENAGFCCHPNEYDHIKLIYVNRFGSISVANVQGMIARRCGCA